MRVHFPARVVYITSVNLLFIIYQAEIFGSCFLGQGSTSIDSALQLVFEIAAMHDFSIQQKLVDNVVPMSCYTHKGQNAHTYPVATVSNVCGCVYRRAWTIIQCLIIPYDKTKSSS